MGIPLFIAWINLYQDRLILYDAKRLFYRRLDGTGGEDIGSLTPDAANSFDFVGMSNRTIMTRRGYTYTGQIYATNQESVIRFVRMPVSGGEMEVVWEYVFPGKNETAHQMDFTCYYGLGDKVYFFILDRRLGVDETFTRLYCYDTEKDEVSLYQEFAGELGRAYPRNGKWYYVYEDAFYSWDPATGEKCCPNRTSFRFKVCGICNERIPWGLSALFCEV